MVRSVVVGVAVMMVLAGGAVAEAADVGQVKTSSGAVHIERQGQRVPATVGQRVQPADVVVTGADGSVGITFLDGSLLSMGPGSTLAIDRFAFDSTTHQGVFETSLRKGTLAAVSGTITKQASGAMKMRTPAAIIGVRGTEFVVRTDE